MDINNTKLSIADKEETYKNKEKMELIEEEILKKKRKNRIKNDKCKEKEDKAEIEKFHEICINFYSNKIINDSNKKNHHKVNLNNSVLPSIKTDRILNLKDCKSKANLLLSNIFSRNANKTNRKFTTNQSLINILFELTKPHKKVIKLHRLSEKFFSLNKDISKDGSNNINYIKSKLKSIEKEKEKEKSISKAGKIEKDVFVKYFKKYAHNNQKLNLSLIFNKINSKGNHKSMNSGRYKQISSSITNKNAIKKEDLLFSRNQKLSACNSNDNIFSVSQNIKSKNLNNSSIFSKNQDIKFYEDKKCSANLLNNEIEKANNLQIKPYTDRKIINKSINHPYYSPSVMTKRKKYGLFMKNIYYNKDKKNKIEIKFLKDFGFHHFALDKFDTSKKSI